jgi:hypothetical protein
MPIICEDYQRLLESYVNTIPTYNILFRVTKCCGYSQLVTVSRNRSANYYHPPIVNLLEQINLQMGEWTRYKVFYYPKITDGSETSQSHKPKYLHHENMFEPLVSFACANLQTAYSVDDCQYTVYQLYLEDECNHSCNCDTPQQVQQDMEMEPDTDGMNQMNSDLQPPQPLPPAVPYNYPSDPATNLDYVV